MGAEAWSRREGRGAEAGPGFALMLDINYMDMTGEEIQHNRGQRQIFQIWTNAFTIFRTSMPVAERTFRRQQEIGRHRR